MSNPPAEPTNDGAEATGRLWGGRLRGDGLFGIAQRRRVRGMQLERLALVAPPARDLAVDPHELIGRTERRNDERLK